MGAPLPGLTSVLQRRQEAVRIRLALRLQGAQLRADAQQPRGQLDGHAMWGCGA